MNFTTRETLAIILFTIKMRSITTRGDKLIKTWCNTKRKLMRAKEAKFHGELAMRPRPRLLTR